uniref:Uncharacterized protein n=2 Tax=Panagrolaimus sp. JU765 TaxID=591449 RepID=A0AC34QZU8_9BILA
MAQELPGQAAEDERNSRSFIIANLPELKVVFDDDCHNEDYRAACDLCRFLGLPVPIDKSKVERIGIRLIDSVYRDMKVELIDRQSIALLFQRLHCLKANPPTSNLEITRAGRLPPIKNYRWLPDIGFTIDQTIPAPPRRLHWHPNPYFD